MTQSRRVLGIQIANGFSPEARVFASLLKSRSAAPRDEPLLRFDVFHHEWSGDTQSILRFQEAAGSDVVLHSRDFGWRQITKQRSIRAKTQARLKFMIELPKALQAAKSVNPDVIYSCQQRWDCVAATYIARRLGKPQIIHLHYVIGPWLQRPVLERLKHCAHIVTVSNFIREQVLQFGVSSDRVTTIRNTMKVADQISVEKRVAVRNEIGIAPDAPVVGIVARVDPSKGQADTIRAYSRIAAKHPDSRLLIIGAETIYLPGYVETVKKIAADAGVASSTIFLGARNDVPALLGALDVFIHPSRMDPCPLALLEAAASGLPSVAYAEGGACEIIADGKTGLLAAPGDEAELGRLLDVLLNDLPAASAMGRVSRERIDQEFRPEEASEAFHRLLLRAFVS